MATNNHLAPLRTPHALTPSSRPTTTTPSRRAISADPSNTITASGRRAASITASARRRGVFNATTTANTPHAKAAFRSLDQRRAAIFTPGRRRLSGLRDARGRETPRDVLRDLSRALAPATTVIASSSSSGSGGVTSSSSPGSGGDRRRRTRKRDRRSGDTTLGTLDGFDDDDDDFPIERPRFSLPGIGDDFDDDDADLKPPRLSGLEDMDYTAQSIEMPRRAWSEGRLDRGSLGSVRFSDYNGPELLSDAAADIDSGFFPPPGLDDDDDDEGMVMDEQGVVERFDADEARRQTLGGETDFGPIEIPEAGDETTFVMAPVESPVRDPTTMFDEGGSEGGFEGGFDDEMPPGVGDDDDDDDDDDVNVDESAATAGLLGLVDDNGGDITAADETTMLSRTADLTSQLTSRAPRRKKTGKKISKHGIEYPSLPSGVVKRLATTFAKTAGVGKAKISADTLDAIMQATDWFFEQLADDLQAYANHAGRKTIDETDMVTLMRRQRQTSASTTPFALAQRHLPRELLQELRMPVPAPTKAPRKKARRIEVDDEEDAT